MERRFSRTHRVLHWSMFAALTMLFLTGFLRMTWMDKRQVGTIIHKSSQGVIAAEDAINIAKDVRAPMWQFHVYFAYIMAAIFIARVIYMAVKGIRFPSPFRRDLSLKRRFEGAIYALFYVFIGFQIFTGFFHMWAPASPLKSELTSLHKLALYWFPIFILLHFLGFILSEIFGEKGVVSKMIGGE